MNAQAVAEPASIRHLNNALTCLPENTSEWNGPWTINHQDTETVNVGGVTVRLWFATGQLRDLVYPALQHLAGPREESVRLTIAIYDRQSTLKFPGLPCPLTDSAPLAQRQNEAAYAYDSSASFIHHTDEVSYCYISEPASFPSFERAAPLRILLTYILGRRGRFIAHTAAVSNGSEGVLIVGSGGAGKSTTSLSCLTAGMDFAGDDYCLLSADGTPHVHSLYGTAKLAIPGTAAFPSLLPAADPASRQTGEKLVFLLNKLPHVKLSPGFPIRAILLPRIMRQRHTQICPAHPAKGYVSLTPSGGYHLPSIRGKALKCFSAIARSVPAYELQLGSDLRSVPDAIKDFLSK